MPKTPWVLKLIHIIQTVMTSLDTRWKLLKASKNLKALKVLNKCKGFNAVYRLLPTLAAITSCHQFWQHWHLWLASPPHTPDHPQEIASSLMLTRVCRFVAWDLTSCIPVLYWTWRMKYRLVHSLILTTVLDGWKKEAESVFIQSIELPVVHIIGK